MKVAWGLAVAVVLGGCRRSPPVDVDGDGWLLGPDCHDGTPLVNPEMDEIPGDGLDNDCDPSTRDDDGDQDGLLPPRDCDDADPDVPGPAEIPDNGIDDDCDPETPDPTPAGELDLDGDGLPGAADCDDADPAVGGPQVWFEDCDGDGFAAEDAASVSSCEPPACGGTLLEPVHPPQDPDNTTTDCLDSDPDAFPGQTSFFSSPNAHPTFPFDYDCDGVPVRQYPPFSCFPSPSMPGACIVPGPGWEGLIGCGQTGTLYLDCLPGPACSPADPVEEVAACR